MKRVLFIAMLCFLVVGPVRTVNAAKSTTDLWDISQGGSVDSTTGVMNYCTGWRSDIRDMFGAATAPIEAGNTLFRDYVGACRSGGSVPAGFVHNVIWHTPSPITLRSFVLNAADEAEYRRAFDHFELFVGASASGPWTSIYSNVHTHTDPTELAVNVTPVVSKYFKAEFVQASSSSPLAVGPLIQELDGYDTFLPGADTDGDGVNDDVDNCPDDPNPGQEDLDDDGVGDACDDDVDGDGVDNDHDNCPIDPNAGQEDLDGDDVGDACDDDIDGDGVDNGDDYCPATVIPEGVPTMGYLNPNHWALTADGNGFDFDTVIKGKGKGPNRSYNIEDTAGCSCEQIIEMQGLGEGHTTHGCSISAMDDWLMLVNP